MGVGSTQISGPGMEATARYDGEMDGRMSTSAPLTSYHNQLSTSVICQRRRSAMRGSNRDFGARSNKR